MLLQGVHDLIADPDCLCQLRMRCDGNPPEVDYWWNHNSAIIAGS